MMHELGERIATRSTLFIMADGKVEMPNGPALKAANPDKYFLMGADPRLPKMPAKPTLIDFFNNRFASLNHLLQSARTRSRAATTRRSCSPACCTTSASRASSVATTAIGARR